MRESGRGESVIFLCLGLIVRFKYYRVILLIKYGLKKPGYEIGLRLG